MVMMVGSLLQRRRKERLSKKRLEANTVKEAMKKRIEKEKKRRNYRPM